MLLAHVPVKILFNNFRSSERKYEVECPQVERWIASVPQRLLSTRLIFAFICQWKKCLSFVVQASLKSEEKILNFSCETFDEIPGSRVLKAEHRDDTSEY